MPADPDFVAVYRKHVGLVWRALRSAGLPDTVLEDATQEVFLTYYRRRDEFRGDSSVGTWLWGIARRVASNHRRGERRFARRLAARRAEPNHHTPDDPERAAAKAQAMGFPVVAAVRSAPTEQPAGNIRFETGEGSIHRVAAASQALINVLPLTPETLREVIELATRVADELGW